MKRSDLQPLLAGLDEAKQKDAIDAILNLHNSEIEAAKSNPDLTGYVKKEDFDKVQTENASLKATVDSRKDYDDLKAFKASSEAKAKAEAQDAAIEKLFKESKANEKVIGLLAKSVDRSAIKTDDKGAITNGAEIVEAAKKSYPDLFVTQTESGASPAKPAPAAPAGKHYTIDEIKAMKPEDINANWADVQASLKNPATK
jgi:hypothetical protein